MAKGKKKKQKKEVEIGNSVVDVRTLYDLVKEKNGNVHPDYCFFYKEWEEERGFGNKIVPMKDEGLCNKVNLDTLCCNSYLDPVKMIRPDNPKLGCAMSPTEGKSKETVLKINPIKLSKRLRKQGLL